MPSQKPLVSVTRRRGRSSSSDHGSLAGAPIQNDPGGMRTNSIPNGPWRWGRHGVTPTDSGDHVLEVGRSMWVRPGQRVVIEAWNASGASYFSWDPVFEPIKVKAPRRRVDFAAALQPLADLRMAMVLAGDALRRLVVVLARQVVPATHNGRHGQACPAR